MDLLGKALLDYYQGKAPKALWSHGSLGDEEEVPVSYFFRAHHQMPPLEQMALEHCRGKVLDIGCGAGSHSLYLQEQGMACLGLDHSPMAIEVARLRGVKETACENILDFRVGDFDTLLLLMNGIGIAGDLEGLRALLKHLAGLLRPGGQILLDSTDIIYMFEADEDGGVWIPGGVSYYGEVTYQWSYGKKQGESFPWLFLDFRTLEEEAALVGLEAELLETGAHFDYLARLRPGAYHGGRETV
jgi:SAM-dependent methyltransferase